ncbi:MAG: MFS transporter [Alphaproteobacteria bacterium]|nr:MFS transporter [Alphaproteobacteria bacterium]
MPSQNLWQTIIVLFFLIAVQATSAISGFWLPAIAPNVAQDLGVDAALVGVAVMILYFAAMLSSLAVGGFVRRFGAWRTSQIALAGFALAHIIQMQGSLWSIALGAIIQGISYGFVTPPASHLLQKVVTPKNRNLLFSIRFTGVPLGGVVTGLLAPPLTLELGWQSAMLFVVFFSCFLIIVMQPLRKNWDHDRDHSAALLRDPRSDMVKLWQSKSLRYVALFSLCMGAVQTTLTTFTTTALVADAHLSLVVAGLGLAYLQFAGVFGRLLWGWMADKMGQGMVVAAFVAVIAAISNMSAMLLHEGLGTTIIFVGCFILGLTGLGWNGVYASEIARRAPKDQVSQITGASMFFTFSGVFWGPSIYLFAHALLGSYALAFLASVIMAGLAALCCYMAQRNVPNP